MLGKENKKYITCSGCKGNHYQDLFGETVLCMRCNGVDKSDSEEPTDTGHHEQS